VGGREETMHNRFTGVVTGVFVLALALGLVALAADNGVRPTGQAAGGSAVATAPGVERGEVQLGDLNEAPSEASEASQSSARIECSNLSCSECFYLDTYNPSHTVTAAPGTPWVLGPVSTSGILVANQWYLITISGDVSFWGQDNTYSPNWTYPQSGWSGTPGNPPIYPSPHAVNGYTGFDFEYLFAVPYAHSLGHLPGNDISLDNGATWADYVPVGGQNYNPAHIYKYLVLGQGKRAKFQTTDTGPTADNSGRYKICVQAVCGNDGTSSR
jgi:hypothetical protein